jgi:DNA-binding PadR family transcriptional regulator
MQSIQRMTKATILVLEQLAEHESGVWGLALCKKLQMPTGTIYPMLARLEDLGWVSSYWESEGDRVGPRRKYFSLTSEALAQAEALLGRAKPLKPKSKVAGAKHA